MPPCTNCNVDCSTTVDGREGCSNMPPCTNCNVDCSTTVDGREGCSNMPCCTNCNVDCSTTVDGREGCSNMPPCTFFLGVVLTAHLQRHLSAKYIEQSRCFDVYSQHPAYNQTAEKCFSRFSTFSVTVDQTWQKKQIRHFVRFVRNFLSPALLTLQRAEEVPIDPLLV